MGYLKTTIKGSSWIGTLKLFSRLFSIFRTMIIARVLSPSQVGVFGIATIALSLVETLTETGINIVLIQKKENIEDYINTAWIVSILRGAIIFLVIFLSAGFVAKFFKSEDAYSLLILVSVVPLIRGFINPSIIKFQKDLEFNKEFYYRLSILIVETTASLLLVLFSKQPISLVWGMVISAIFEVILSFVIVKPIPRIKFNKSKFLDILSHGKWVTSSGIFGYLFSNGDNIVVGRMLGTSSLGIYDMAYSIALLPTTEISEVIARVTFPVYVKFSEDRQRLKRAFMKTTTFIVIATIPITLVLWLFPTQIIMIFLGDKWLEAVPILKALSIFGALIAVTSPVGAVFNSVKKQKYNFIITFLGFMVMIVTIYPFILRWGLIGAAYSAILATVVSLVPILYFLNRIFYKKENS